MTLIEDIAVAKLQLLSSFKKNLQLNFIPYFSVAVNNR